MDTRRVILYAALALIAYSLWTSWQVEHPVAVPAVTTTTTAAQTSAAAPVIPANEASTVAQPSLSNQRANDLSVDVHTDVLHLKIGLEQGDIIHTALLDYPLSTAEKNKPFVLLQNNPGERYVANSELFVLNNGQPLSFNPNFNTQYQTYQLRPDQDKLDVVLQGKTADGIAISKTFTFKRGSYLIDIQYSIANNSDMPWKGYMNTQLLRASPQEDTSSMFHVGSYTGASYSQPGQHRYEKVNFKTMSKGNLDVATEGGWIAMQQHYFLTAWVPPVKGKNRFYTRAVGENYTIGAVSESLTLHPGQSGELGSRLYLGPENTSVLKAISPGLDLTVDYGWLWFLSSILFTVMKTIYSVIGNWGWSIVLVTVLVKLLFYRLSATSYKSMAGMRKLQPKLQALRERYGDDKAKISQGTMELYRQEKVNPLGGCLPIVIQIPVFIALYWVLLESVELRQAPFIGWIHDLSAADPYHILPIIMGASMLVQQRLNPAPPDPMQAKIMMFLPVMFTALFWNFPAGLVLYWVVNNSLSILQQWYITRKYSDAPVANKRLTTK